jgi:hypothetical protein
MAEPELHSIQGSKITDAERAKQIRAELVPALEAVCEIITRARREGINVQFQLGPDGYGQQKIGMLDLFKAI